MSTTKVKIADNIGQLREKRSGLMREKGREQSLVSFANYSITK